MSKKKVTAIIISLAMILSFSITACKKTTEKPDISLEPINTEDANVSEQPSATPPILKEDLAKFGIVLNKILIREENYTQYPYIQEWQDYINEQYNIDIKINFVQVGFQYFTDYYLQNRDKTNATGIVYLSDFRGDSDIKKLIDNDAIMSLDDLLADNTTFNKMPIEFRDMFKYSDNKTWAIPGEIRYNGYLVRLTKTKWLEAIGLDTPTSYAELFEVARRFKTKDPDGDGKNNTYGLNTFNNYTFRGLQDLFQANGAYLAENPDFSTAYNPNTGTYEDAMLSDHIYDVLSFIRSMMDEDLIDTYGFTGGTTYGLIRKNSGSIAAYATDALPEHSYSMIRESQQDQVSLMQYASSAYIMLKDTPHAKEMLNNFINIFLGDIEAHKMLRFGMPGVSYEENGQNIILHDKNRNNSDLLPRVFLEMEDPELLDPAKQSPLYGTQMTPVFYEQPYYVFYNEYDEYVKDYQEKALVDAKKYFDQNPNLFYEIPILSKGFVTTFNVNGSLFSDVAKRTYGSGFSIQDIIDSYITDSKYFNVLDQLDQINAQLGLQTKYRYKK